MTKAKAAISNHSSLVKNSETGVSLESEERFRLVLDASPDGFIILRSVRDASGAIADFTIEYTNPVAAAGLESTPEQVVGLCLSQLFPDYKTSGIFERYIAVTETGISTTFETFYDRKSLSGWFRNVVVKSNDGIAVSFSNITDSHILESITDAFIAFDHDWRYTYINQEAARMLGRSPQELLGRRWQDVFPEIAQQDTAAGRALHKAMEEQVTVRLETFSLATQRWIEMSVFPSSNRVALSFHDISDRKRVEAERKRTEQRREAQYAIARILTEVTTVDEAAAAILPALCENLDWQVGVIWHVDPDRSALRSVNCWQSSNGEAQAFVAATQQLITQDLIQNTDTQNTDLPRQVWSSHQPIWIAKLDEDSSSRSALAVRSGLQSAFGFPIQLGDEVLGVIECFSTHVQEPDSDLLQMMTAIGSQIGQFMERKRTEAALRESQELFQSFMTYSPIAAFIKDET